MSGQERVKHMVSGGYSKNKRGAVTTWEKPSSTLTKLLEQDCVRNAYGKPLGTEAPKPGTFKLCPPQNYPTQWNNSPAKGNSIAACETRGCDFVVSKRRDKCEKNSWVCFQENNGSTTQRLGRISDIFEKKGSISIVVEEARLMPEIHPYLQTPLLRRELNGDNNHIVKSDAILFDFNVQQEDISGHGDEIFIINTHSLHHGDLLYEMLPRHMTNGFLQFVNHWSEYGANSVNSIGFSIPMDSDD